MHTLITKTTTLPECVTRTPHGFFVKVKIGGRTLSKRFRRRPDLTVEELANTRDEFRLELRRAAESIRTGAVPAAPTPAPATLDDDRIAYLDEHLGAVHANTRDQWERYLLAWCNYVPSDGGPRLGDRARATIRTATLIEAINEFERHGIVRPRPLEAETYNKVRLCLYRLYEVMNGVQEMPEAANPVRHVPRRTPPKAEARGQDYGLLEAILEKIPPGKTKGATKARLVLMAYHGLRPVEIMSIRRGDWNPAAAELYVRTGKGGKHRTIQLIPKASAALETLERLGAWGPYPTETPSRAFKKAKIAAGYELDITPYDLRHSFGTWVYKATGDIKMVKESMAHSSIRMTERYVEAAVSPMLKEVHKKLMTAFGDAPPPPPARGKRQAAAARRAANAGPGLTLVPSPGAAPAADPVTPAAATPTAIQALRHALGESVATFGARFARSGRVVEDWEQGKRTPNALVVFVLETLAAKMGGARRAGGKGGAR
jgi:integrase